MTSIQLPQEAVRRVTLQLIRSAVQYLVSRITTYPLLLEAADLLGVDVVGSLTTVLTVAGFLLYLLLVRALEKLHPLFGWLNGWRAELEYQN